MRGHLIQKNRFWGIVLLISLFLAGGCSGGGGDGATAASTASSGTAKLASDQTTIDFGNQVIGQTAERELALTNTGTANLEIGAIEDQGGAFAVSGPCANSTLTPQQTCTMVVGFTPQEQLEYSGSFRVDSNAGDLPIALTGIGRGLSVGIGTITPDCADSTVQAQVLVSNYDREPVPGLDQSNFTVSLNNETLASFSISAIPVSESASVALALDWSNSFRDFRPAIRESAKQFIDLLQDTDRAAVFRFATAVDEAAQPFIDVATGREILKDAVDSNFIGATSPTLLWDAVDYAVQQTAAEPNQKRAVILLTDGYDNDSATSFQDLVARARNNNVVIFTIGLGTTNPGVLEQLAQETGGIAFSALTTDSLQTIYEDIANLLTNQYELTFTNPSPTTANLLEVEVADQFGWTGVGTRDVAACP